ncbi:MAG: YlmC/YmxH family sporulation protein [Chloroflexota bacterium]
MIRVSDLRQRDVINTTDGRRLGVISDLDVDLATGRITGLVILGQARLLGLLGRGGDIYIPWDKIVKIGSDVILVEVTSGFIADDVD